MSFIDRFYTTTGTEIPPFPKGLVWLVGAGAGDPGLITMHGMFAISRADVVIYDALVNSKLLELCNPAAEKIYAGKRGGKPSVTQQDISHILIELAKKGNRIVRLKGGDPFVFGRGGDEALALARDQIPIRITPGISAGIGGLAYAGIPLTYRETNQSVTFMTGHDQFGDAPQALNWELLAKGSQVLVIYMAIKNLDKIVKCLLTYGRKREEPIAVISNATLEEQRFLESTLGKVVEDVKTYEMKAPSIICIGWNVHLHRIITPAINSLLKNPKGIHYSSSS
ncbi:MAG: uroporphyrinogen-III C-methyltransferase [Rhodobacteraceae bacterium]|nr:uroporphyrinogen-III C-methyltransferase [Paracoccaceae bacterium]